MHFIEFAHKSRMLFILTYDGAFQAHLKTHRAQARGSARCFHASSLPCVSRKAGSGVTSLRLLGRHAPALAQPKLRGKDCPSFARCCTCSCAARRRASAPSGGNDILGTRGGKMIWIKIGCKKCGIQVPLHGTDATGALMPALR